MTSSFIGQHSTTELQLDRPFYLFRSLFLYCVYQKTDISICPHSISTGQHWSRGPCSAMAQAFPKPLEWLGQLKTKSEIPCKTNEFESAQEISNSNSGPEMFHRVSSVPSRLRITKAERKPPRTLHGSGRPWLPPWGSTRSRLRLHRPVSSCHPPSPVPTVFT